MTRIDALTAWINRHAGILWALLLASLGMWAYVGGEPVAQSEVGRGYVLLDLIATGLLWLSAGTLLILMTGKTHSNVTPMDVGDVLMLIAITLFGSRLTWALVATGDPLISLSGILGIICFAIGIVCYSEQRLMNRIRALARSHEAEAADARR